MQTILEYCGRCAAALKPSYVLVFLSGALLVFAVGMFRESNAQPRQHVYELRMYHVNEGKMPDMKARFGNHTDGIFKRHNMKSIGYWTPQDPPGSQNLLIYVLEHPSRQDAEKNWAAFIADPEWKKVKADSEVNGPLVNRIERYYMDPTTFSALK